MPNPLHQSITWVKADLPNLPAGSTASAKFPTATVPLDRVQVQVGWDGTPDAADNREDAAIRVTVWASPDQTDLAIDEAEGLYARLLKTGTSAMWRVDRGANRLYGTDPDTGNQFCTFTLQPVFLAPTP